VILYTVSYQQHTTGKFSLVCHGDGRSVLCGSLILHGLYNDRFCNATKLHTTWHM